MGTNEETATLVLEVVPRMMRVVRHLMREHGESTLTVPQFRVLNRVYRVPASNQELADWMGVRPPTMSKMIDGLVKRGLLSRKTESHDRRQILVTCTSKGTELAREIRGAVHAQLTQRVSQITRDQNRAIEKGLRAMKETLL